MGVMSEIQQGEDFAFFTPFWKPRMRYKALRGLPHFQQGEDFAISASYWRRDKMIVYFPDSGLSGPGFSCFPQWDTHFSNFGR